MRGGKVAAGVVALSLSVFGQASPARACSGLWDNCLKADTFPKNGGSVPANVPAVGYVVGTADTSYPWTGGHVELSTLGGASVEGTIQAAPWGAWIAPDAPLQSGASYVMRYLEPCPDAFHDEAGTGGQFVELTFTATDSVPEPTSFGTLGVASYEEGDVAVSVSSTCALIYAHSAVVQLAVELSPELQALLPVTRFWTSVDGAVQGGSMFGTFEHSPPLFAYWPIPDADWAYAPCDDADALGPHTVTVRAEVAGAPELELSASVDVVFACDIAEPDAGTPVDSSVDDALSLDAVPPGDAASPGDASALDGSSVDASIPSDASYSVDTGLVAEVGADADVFAMDADPTPGGGCAMAGGVDHRRARAFWPTIALGVLVSLARKRRLHVRGTRTTPSTIAGTRSCLLAAIWPWCLLVARRNPRRNRNTMFLRTKQLWSSSWSCRRRPPTARSSP